MIGDTVAFTWKAWASRVILRDGALDDVPAEVDRLGAGRVLLVGGGAGTATARQRLRERLGGRVVDVVEEAAPHAPLAAASLAADRARDSGADAVIAVGGGAATGLGKAVAVTCGLPLVVVPTTYAGSEMTPVWSHTEGGRKTTARDDRAVAVAVVYDPSLYRHIPARLAGASGMNALAHCLEALWLPGTSPMTDALAERGVRHLLAGLPRVVADSGDVDAQVTTLAGACLAGVAFAQAGSGIHHRTCHVLGGGWNLPHAETHAILLPHSTALVTARRPQARDRLVEVLGDPRPAGRVLHLREELGLPESLADLGFPGSAVGEAATRVLAAAPDDPLAEPAAVTAMLADAQSGRGVSSP